MTSPGSRAANEWDRKVRTANVELTTIDRGRICERVIRAFPPKRIGRKLDRARLAAIVIFCAERSPPPTTVEVTKGIFPGHSTRNSRSSQANQALLKLRDASLLRESYDARYVGEYARRQGGQPCKTGLSKSGAIVREHTARWELM